MRGIRRDARGRRRHGNHGRRKPRRYPTSTFEDEIILLKKHLRDSFRRKCIYVLKPIHYAAAFFNPIYKDYLYFETDDIETNMDEERAEKRKDEGIQLIKDVIGEFSGHQAVEQYAEQKEFDLEAVEGDVSFDPESFDPPPSKKRRLNNNDNNENNNNRENNNNNNENANNNNENDNVDETQQIEALKKKIEKQILKQLKNYDKDRTFDRLKEKNTGKWYKKNPLTFWNSPRAHREYPDLRIIASKVLVNMPSSCATERLFSDVSNVVTPKRSSLTPDNVKMLVFLYDALNHDLISPN